MRMRLRVAAAGTAAFLFWTQGARPAERWDGPRLLVTAELLKAVEAKAASRAWAGGVLKDLLAEADRWSARPVDPPTTGGGWHHNYVCPKDAGFLEYREDSPHRHWCPRCKRYYEGEQLDATWVNRRHMDFALAAETCALARRLGGKPGHGDWARQVLLWYAQRYASFPVHGKWAGRGKVTSQSLDEAMWLIRMADAFDLLSPDLSDTDQRLIIDKLILPAGRHIGRYRLGVHNIQCWHAAARLMAGLIGSDAGMRDQAIQSLRENISKGITQEGMWFEVSPGYHQFTLMALTPALLAAKQNNLDLGPDDRLPDMYTVLGKLALPGYEVPALNDGGGGNLANMAYFLETGGFLFNSDSLRGQLAAIYAEKLRDRTKGSLAQKLPALLWGPADLPDDSRLEFGSHLLRDTGLAVLRHNGNTVIIKAGRVSGGHDHADRCNLILADANHVWFADLGTSGYGHRLYRPWYRHTASHCTVMVDGKPQKINVAGEFLQFEVKDDHPLVTVGCDEAYEGVVMTRTVAMVDGVVLDRFAVSSDAEHEYAFLLRASGDFKPGPGSSRPTEGTAYKLSEFPLPSIGWESQLSGSWSDGQDRLDIAAGASVPFASYAGKVPGFPGEAEQSALALVARSKAIVFAAAHSTTGDSTDVVSTVRVSGEGTIAFSTDSGGTYSMLLSRGQVSLAGLPPRPQNEN